MNVARTNELARRLPPDHRLVRELARVPMRLTVLAEHHTSGQRAVLVLPTRELLTDPDQLVQLRWLADATASLRHPHILPLRATNESSTQLISSVPPTAELAALIPGASPPAAFLPVLAGIADALDASHRAGLYHGDLSADDILIDLRTGHACLSGFGVSPAPESASDGVDLDLEELGSLLEQCLTEQPPTAAAPPPELATVLRRALTSDAAQRYPSCRAMIDAAAEVLLPPAGLQAPLAPRPVQDPARTRRRRLIIGGVIAAVLLLVVVAVVLPMILAVTTPTSAEMARMPEPVRSGCAVVAPGSTVPSASRQVRCKDVTSQALTSGLYDTEAEAEAGYRAAMASAPGVRGGDVDCSTGTGGEHRYPGVGAEAGRVLCDRSNAGVRMVWLDRANRTVSVATRTDGNAALLYQSWARWVQIPEFLTPVEQQMIDQLSFKNCRRAPSGYLDEWGGAIAALDCHQPGDGTTSVRYLRFADIDQLHRQYQAALGGLDIKGTANCSLGPAGGFRGDDTLEIIAQGFGRFACTPGKNSPTLIWTIDPLRMVGAATGTDPSLLTNWWLEKGRPDIRPLVTAIDGQQQPAFPNADEASVVAQLPNPEQKYCIRPSAQMLKGLFGDLRAVSVACHVPLGLGTVFYSRYADRNELATELGPGGGPDCTTNPRGFRGSARYTRPSGATGVLNCAVTGNGLPFLDWTDEKTGIRATVFGDAADQVPMIDWWQRNAG